jgi:hypothetical protein
MAYEHSMDLKAKVVAGTTLEQVAEAFRPIMEHMKYEGIDAFTKAETVTGDDLFNFDPQTGDIFVSTCGEVGYDYIDCVREVAGNLGKIVAEAGEIVLYDHDTPYVDEVKTVIEFGPSEDAIKAYIVKRDLESSLALMRDHVDDATFAVARDVLNVWYLRTFREALY